MPLPRSRNYILGARYPEKRVRQFSMLLPRVLDDLLIRRAYRDRVSKARIVVDALTAYFERNK